MKIQILIPQAVLQQIKMMSEQVEPVTMSHHATTQTKHCGQTGSTI